MKLTPTTPVRPANVDPSRQYAEFMRGTSGERSPVISHSGGRIHLTLPLPPKEAMKNFHGHWSKSAKAVKVLREAACRAMLEARLMGGLWRQWTHRVIAEFTFYAIDKRTDVSNRLDSTKALIDGFQDAGLFRNDKIVIPRLSDDPDRVDKSNPRCEVVLWEVPRDLVKE